MKYEYRVVKPNGDKQSVIITEDSSELELYEQFNKITGRNFIDEKIALAEEGYRLYYIGPVEEK